MKQTIKKKIRNILLQIAYILLISAIVLVLFKLFLFSKYSDRYFINNNRNSVYALPMPDKVFFANERVPIENFDVRESLDKELHKIAFWHSEMLLYIKRANRYFPAIEAMLKRNGVPDDFKYVCVTESGLTNVVSPAGAAGFWQFMRTTGREYGLIINKEVDERYNWKKATLAACKYLKKRYKKYGSWAMVAASYNAGDGGVNKFMSYQKTRSYYDLALYKETSRYVYRAIAIKLIMENPKEYGFNYGKRDLYPVLDTKQVDVDSTISNMANFARSQGMTYKVFKLLNPWLRKHQLSNASRLTYSITVLKKNARSKDYFRNKKNKIIEKKQKIRQKQKDEELKKQQQKKEEIDEFEKEW